MPGAFQDRNAIAPETSNIEKVSLNVGTAAAKVKVDKVSSAAATMKANTINFIPKEITPPIAFSAKNLVCVRNPNGNSTRTNTDTK